MQKAIAYCWLIVTTTFTIFCVFFPPLISLALSQEMSQTQFVKKQEDIAFLQATVTPTATLQNASEVTNQGNEQSPQLTSTITISAELEGDVGTEIITFDRLGYEEIALENPVGTANYSLSLPINWQVLGDSFVELDLSYAYLSFESEDTLPLTFGELVVTINGQTVDIIPIEDQSFTHRPIRLALTNDEILADIQANNLLRVGLAFDAGICDLQHKATLIIHPTSYFSLNYVESPLNPDLSTYPLPFHQNNDFDPDEIIFNLPIQADLAEVSGAVSIAAKLGELTRNRMVISSTLSTELAGTLSTPSASFDTHLFVIGKPQNNKMIELLNDVTDLPISLRDREMALVSQGPATVSPAQTLLYTFTITNTTNDSENLTLDNTMPLFTKFVSCAPECDFLEETKRVIWENNDLEAGQSREFSLTLQATSTLTTTPIENTITLIRDDSEPINVDTLTSEVKYGTIQASLQTTNVEDGGDYFFSLNNRGVAENDGIIQEIISPWNKNRAILIISGLNDEAIEKASQALSSETRFPGLNGAFALVQEITHPKPELNSSTAEKTVETAMFADLEYEDLIIQGRQSQQVDYFFYLPPDWVLTNEAVVNLQFKHSQAFEDSAAAQMTVLFNNTPLSTVTLDDETSADQNLQTELLASAARPGQFNQLTIQLVPPAGSGCIEDDEQAFWLLIKNSSSISLSHRESGTNALDLGFYPFPFTRQTSLSDLLFVISDISTDDEWNNILRIAASMGDFAGGDTLRPKVANADGVSENDLMSHHIIAVGRPSRHALIQQINSQLPQPFIPNSDMILQKIDDVVLRLPPGEDLGYIQLILSPMNPDYSFLVVTGTTDQGVEWAAQSLVDSSRRLRGNLALIQGGDNIETIDTRGLLPADLAAAVATSVPNFITTTTDITIGETTSIQPGDNISPRETPPTNQPTLETDPPDWLFPLVVLTAVVVLVIFGVAFIQARR